MTWPRPRIPGIEQGHCRTDHSLTLNPAGPWGVPPAFGAEQRADHWLRLDPAKRAMRIRSAYGPNACSPLRLQIATRTDKLILREEMPGDLRADVHPIRPAFGRGFSVSLTAFVSSTKFTSERL